MALPINRLLLLTVTMLQIMTQCAHIWRWSSMLMEFISRPVGLVFVAYLTLFTWQCLRYCKGLLRFLPPTQICMWLRQLMCVRETRDRRQAPMLHIKTQSPHHLVKLMTIMFTIFTIWYPPLPNKVSGQCWSMLQLTNYWHVQDVCWTSTPQPKNRTTSGMTGLPKVRDEVGKKQGEELNKSNKWRIWQAPLNINIKTP